MGLIINELLTNSLKHAFPDDRKGEIVISSHKTSERELNLIVADNGVGFPKNLKFPHTQSLGLQLIETLINQLNGAVHVESNNKGTKYEIDLNEIN